MNRASTALRIPVSPIIMDDMFTDNIDINISPFKGPFKGKGKNNVAVKSLRNDLSQIDGHMQSIVADFKRASQGRLPVYLYIKKPRGIPQLMWRETGQRSNFLRLFDSDAGKAVLAEVLPATMQLLINYERVRLFWNVRAQIVGHPMEHFNKMRKGNDHLDDLESQLQG